MEMVRVAENAMRSRFEVVMPLMAGASRADLYAAGEEALAEIVRVEAQLSAYRDESDLWMVNECAADFPVKVEARTLAFLATAQKLVEETGGAFDPTVGPLLRLWDSFEETGLPPSAVDRENTLHKVGMTTRVRLNHEDQTVAFATMGMRLDPGAIGKGWALERAVMLLREAGVTNALLHGGTSSVYGLGSGPDGNGWRVAVQHPLEENALLAEVFLQDRALSVSRQDAMSSRMWMGHLGHIVDPRTGYPVEGALLTAVLGDSATMTDAVSTALLVLGVEGVEQLSETFADADFLIAQENKEGSGQEATPLSVVTRGDGWFLHNRVR